MTDPGQARRALELCDATLALPPGERDAYLDQACGGDAALRDAVDSLLLAITRAGDFLDPAAVADDSQLIGTEIGRYRIVERLGEGGMGAVYLAERQAEGYTQRVALKLVRGHLGSREVVERFHAERRILAGLNHPYIAQLVDAGTTEGGTPYLVMEYVDGLPIDRFCDEHHLGLKARVRLLIKVMLAVQAAHQHLVIHRDLKPSNVLVTADGLPKLLDFGIAKLAVADGEDDTANLTRLWGQAMTPNYASPEQILEARATTVSDVYSLGVLAYQLLVGELPYQLEGRSQRELLRAAELIRVASPSTRIRSAASSHQAEEIAAHRGLSASRLAAALAGDLDNILLMALRPEPERRYGSVAQFAEDLGRYLDGRPVAARADTFSYRAGRFLRRHWLPVGAATALVMSLAAGVVSFAWQAEQARAERDRTLKVNEFLQAILLEADPYSAGADATIREVLSRADDMMATRFAGLPDLEAALRRTIGYTQLGLLELDAAERSLARAHALNLSLYGARDRRSIETAADLAWTAFRRGEYEAAREGYETAIGLLGPASPAELRLRLQNDLGLILLETGATAAALEAFERARALQVEAPANPSQAASLLNNLGHAHHDLGQLDEAERYYRLSIESGREAREPGQEANLAIHLNNLALLMRELGRDEEARDMFRESLEIRQVVMGPRHGYTGLGHLQLGRILLDGGEVDTARPHLESALEISTETMPEGSPQLLLAQALAARLMHHDGESAAAAETLATVAAGFAAHGPHLDGLRESVERWREEALEAVAGAPP